ncbi:MAG: ATP phosphoribosyltransferase regulatory subunit [Hyphomonas sp.]
MTEESLAAAALSVLNDRYLIPSVDPHYTLPADIPLELSGEAVRARLCMFTDDRGREMAMRPDLTLPVALREVDRRLRGEQGFYYYIYAGRAFRLPAAPDDPLEFTQVGFEEFGLDSWTADDVRPFYNVRLMLDACAVSPTAVVTGDLAIFPAVIDALGLPEVIRDLLKRAFRQEGGVAELLAATPEPLDADIAAVLDADEPETALRACLAQRNITMIGTRSEAEIIAGLRARAEAASAGGIPAEARRVLEDFGRINCPVTMAASAVSDLAGTHSLTGLDEVIQMLYQRNALMIDREIIDPDTATFRSGFGRRFTYYDGFVFEVLGANLTARQPIAAGGRYNGLIRALSGGKVSSNGIGGVMRPDRVLRALGAGA